MSRSSTTVRPRAVVNQKRRSVGVLVVVLVAGVAGCGSSSSKSALTVEASVPSPTQPSATTSSSEPLAVSTSIQSSMLASIDALGAALNAAGIDCTLVADPPGDSETSETLAPPLDVMGRASCVVGTSRLGLTMYADEANRDMAHAQLEAIYGPMMKSFGVMELLWIQAEHGSWSASIGSSGENLDARPTPNDRDLAAKVAAALAGDVEDIIL